MHSTPASSFTPTLLGQKQLVRSFRSFRVRHFTLSRALILAGAACAGLMTPRRLIARDSLDGPGPDTLYNGGFETGYVGWTATGNATTTSPGAHPVTEGQSAAVFNSGDSAPNGTIAQTFPTTPGQTYTLRFDAGVWAYNKLEQRLQVTVQSDTNLLFETVSLFGLGGGTVHWTPKTYTFVASSPMTTLVFRDVSPATKSLDLMLDNVRLSSSLLNGSFELGHAGWTASGNQSITSAPSAAATDGTHAAVFNSGDSTPNGVLTQSLATSVGQTLVLQFDTGVLAYNKLEQRLQATAEGRSTLLSETVSLSGEGGGSVHWTPRAYMIVADSTRTTLTFRDISPATRSLDLLLDNVRVHPLITNGSFESGYDGWTASGNQAITASSSAAAPDGVHAVVFNGGNSTPNGVLAQSFPTAIGNTYALRFSAGVLAYNKLEQLLQTTISGKTNLLSETVSLSGSGGGSVRWVPQSYIFVADGTAATVTFRDVSPATNSLDLLLDDVRVDVQPAGTDVNDLITNGGFESGTNGAASGWGQQSYLPASDYTWATDAHFDGGHSASIESNTANDAAWTQTLSLTPGAAYTLTGWIKGENIVGGDPGVTMGVNLCLMGTWTSSDSGLGTFDWKQFGVTFLAPSDGVVTVGCRLGFWGNTVTGKAWFDDVALKTLSRRESEHLILDLEPDDLTAFTGTNFDRWLRHLDAAYLKYEDLVGGVPYAGAKIGVLSVYQYPGGWAVAGNPIQWMQFYVKGELTRCNQNDDWSFGILHEIGHDFDIGGWNWSPEFWANFKMYYVVESFGAKVMQNNVYYIGGAVANYYQTDGAQSYSKTVAHGGFSYDALTYCFIRIEKQIGWDPFKQTFRYYLASGTSPARHVDNFNLFLDKLTEYSGFDVRSTFLPGELEACLAAISSEN